VTLARRGAQVTGTDFSAASLAKAGDIGARAGVSIDWVEAESTRRSISAPVGGHPAPIMFTLIAQKPDSKPVD
jgi:hypothetical protein